MHRFFFNSHSVRDSGIEITEKKALHHIKDVLRLKAKEQAVLVDESKTEYLAELSGTGEGKAVFSIIRKRKADKEKTVSVTIACAIPKKSKIDDIVDKLTQLGVGRIIPLQTQRVIVKFDKKAAAARLARWQKIALSASQQSQRNSVPVIDPVTGFNELIAGAGAFDLKLIPHLGEERVALKEALAAARPKNILVLIGPEGDFSPAEVELALRAGFLPVTFGDFVLRVETAAVYVASALTYALG